MSNGPRVTPEQIDDAIVCEQYVTSADIDAATKTDSPSPGVLTIAVLTLANGFQVTGESACAAKENFDRELGQKIARAKAVEKIWPLLGYELRSKLAAEAVAG